MVLLLPSLLLAATPPVIDRPPPRPAPDVAQAPKRLGTIRRIDTDTTGHYAFTPNARYLIYLSRQNGIVRVNRDGSRARRLAGPGPGYFRITPDSQQVVYTVGGDIFRVAVEGGEPVRFESTQRSQLNLTLSPDGKWVAYHTIGGDGYLVGIQGGGTRVIAHPEPRTGTHYQFTADSAGVAYWNAKEIFYRGVHDEGFTRIAPNVSPAWFQYGLSKGAVIMSEQDAQKVFYLAPYDGSPAVPYHPPTDEPRIYGRVGNNWIKGKEEGWYVHTRITREGARRGYLPLTREQQLEQRRTGRAPKRTLAPWSSAQNRRWAVDLVSTERDMQQPLVVATGYTVVAAPTEDAKRVIVHTEVLDDSGGSTQTLYEVSLRTGAVVQIGKPMPGWSNAYPSPDGQFVVFTVPTSPRGQPRRQDLYTLELAGTKKRGAR